MNSAHVVETAMTVGQLREMLESYEEDAKVFFVSDYGDHCHTQQALPLNEVLDADTSCLKDSAYSNSGLCVIEDRPDDEDYDNEREEDEEIFPIVLFKS